MVSKVATTTVVLPEKVLEALKEKSESEGKAVEELIGEALFRQLNIVDPEAEVELHLELCEKYLREAEDFLAKGDYAQASEKTWGAASQMVKAVAARKGLELRSHGGLHKEIVRLTKETGDDEIRSLWQSAISLHQNFYENWLPPEIVEWNVNDVKKLVNKLKGLV